MPLMASTRVPPMLARVGTPAAVEAMWLPWPSASRGDRNSFASRVYSPRNPST